MVNIDLKTQGLTNSFPTDFRILQNINGSIGLFGEINNALPFSFHKKAVSVQIDNAIFKLNKTRCEVFSNGTKIDFKTQKVTSQLALQASPIRIHYKNAKNNIGKIEFYLVNLSFFYFPNANHSVNINGMSLKFEQIGDQLAINKYLESNNSSLITTKVIIENLKNVSLKHLYETMKDISWLCSFATGNLVSIARVDIYDKDKNIKIIELFESGSNHITNFPIIKVSNEPGLFMNYINHTIAPFQQHKNTLLLPNLINLLFLAKQATFIELKMLILANFLEVLRFNFADNIAVPNGTYSKHRSDFYRYGQVNGRKKSFEEILKDFCNFNRSTGWLPKYKDMRNEIVHTGKVEGSSKNKIRDVAKLQEFCERIILGILDWDTFNGQYLSSSCPEIPSPRRIGLNYIRFKR
jgi:hypothetical protein